MTHWKLIHSSTHWFHTIIYQENKDTEDQGPPKEVVINEPEKTDAEATEPEGVGETNENQSSDTSKEKDNYSEAVDNTLENAGELEGAEDDNSESIEHTKAETKNEKPEQEPPNETQELNETDSKPDVSDIKEVCKSSIVVVSSRRGCHA